MMSMKELLEVKLDDLVDSPFQVHKVSKGEVKTLKESIEQTGLLVQPIVVRELAGSRLEMATDHHTLSYAHSRHSYSQR